MAGMVQIWNMALGWVGTRGVAAAHENTQEAIQCRLFWDSARRQVLRDFPWNFARRRAWPAGVNVPEGWEGEYGFAFSLPTDCLKVLDVLEEGASGARRARYVLAHDPASARQVLLACTPRVLLAYTADVRQAELFDDLCAHLLARRLATLIAVPLLKNNAQKVQELEQLYRAAIPNAVEADAGEGREEEKPDAWIAARGGCQ